MTDRMTRTVSREELLAEPGLPLALRTELMLMPQDLELERHRDFLVVRSPRNPHYWWGNYVFFDSPPGRGDLARWEEVFGQTIRGVQPASRHTTFSWAGPQSGHVGPFLSRGYKELNSIVLSALEPQSYRHENPLAQIRILSGADWDVLLELMVAERAPEHPHESFRSYARGRIEEWRRRVDAGLGLWFGAYLEGELASTLGLFVEETAGHAGPRLARFQEVTTAVRHRRQGLAGTLVVTACRTLLSEFGALRFVIIADAHDLAQRIYRNVGFELAEHLKGLEKGGY
jgi:RimJ/RimL family protein N-acetyltransferase